MLTKQTFSSPQLTVMQLTDAVVVGYERVAEGGIRRRRDEEQRDKDRDRRVRETSGSMRAFLYAGRVSHLHNNTVCFSSLHCAMYPTAHF